MGDFECDVGGLSTAFNADVHLPYRMNSKTLNCFHYVPLKQMQTFVTLTETS